MWPRSRASRCRSRTDIYKRPFITLGFTGLMLMVPLAVTSTAGWIRRLGGRRWQALHRLGLRDRRRRGDALLVAGEGRHPSSGGVRRRRRGPAGVRVLEPCARARSGSEAPDSVWHLPQQDTAFDLRADLFSSAT